MNKTPDISIVIPVLGEAARIGGVIEHLRRLDGDGRCEIIVVDGDRKASTVSVIDDAGVRALCAARGRARQMNAGAEVARGDILLFLHADTRLPETALDDVLGALAADPAVVGGAFRMRFDEDATVYRWMARAVSALTAVTRCPYGDQAIFVRRASFERLSGYAPIPVFEDIDLCRRIRLSRSRLRVLGTSVTTSARRFRREGVARCVLRNAVIQALYLLGVAPARLARFYPPEPGPAGG